MDTVGVSVNGVRYSAVCICGLLTGLAGTCLTIGQLNMFMDNISAGRGFIALAAVIFGKWNPKGVLFASVIFAFADALQLRLQSLGFQIPYQFLVMLPYVLTVVALAGVVGRSKDKPHWEKRTARKDDGTSQLTKPINITYQKTISESLKV